MRAQITVVSIALLAVFSAKAEATWLSGAIRTTSNYDFGNSNTGSGCQFSGGYYYCPFLSDTTAFFGGDNVNGIFVDYYQTHADGGWVTASACRQSWTGGSYLCASGSTTATTGWQDSWINGFSATGAASVYDYFFVIVTKSGVGESIDQVIGFTAM